eukprot:CAMPEP_0171481154 /NCGR_PEP_ID=MMETSP0946-20130122/6552_1 /TAXON_ID=109269 /ORGANISM="Vaucheria litorea, Strain CCMP2940" /LENGTH=86 /DNA_ID=CAMNT_0012012623 /DNA_START=101 /DNA_END=361 /DNA_ORIENTATION=+
MKTIPPFELASVLFCNAFCSSALDGSHFNSPKGTTCIKLVSNVSFHIPSYLCSPNVSTLTSQIMVNKVPMLYETDPATLPSVVNMA